MPDHERQRQSYRQQLIAYLRAVADQLEAEERAEAAEWTEMRARRLRAQIRRANRRGHITVVLFALWLLQHPSQSLAIAAAAGIIAWGGITTPWTDEEVIGHGPPARPPQAQQPSPGASRAASSSPTSPGETPAGPVATRIAGPSPQPVPADDTRKAAPSPSPSPSAPMTPSPTEPAIPHDKPGCLVDLDVPFLGDIELLCGRPDLDPPFGVET